MMLEVVGIPGISGDAKILVAIYKLKIQANQS
jgi:hypothetical protein